MERISIILLITLFFGSCKIDSKTENSSKSNSITLEVEGRKIKSYNFETLEPLLNKIDNKTYVINFWATWCKPCIEELPAFEKLNEVYRGRNVKVILVSLDFPNQLEKRLIPYIKDHNIKSKVVLMSDPDQNNWIPKIDKDWSGAIPATLIYNRNERVFYEQSFTYELLENELIKFIKAK